jgi:hypothetical protein
LKAIWHDKISEINKLNANHRFMFQKNINIRGKYDY